MGSCYWVQLSLNLDHAKICWDKMSSPRTREFAQGVSGPRSHGVKGSLSPLELETLCAS
jgi:hypothetical protein